MKTKMLLQALIVGFIVVGSGCTIVDGFLVAVNIKGVTGCHKINPGDPFYDEDTTFTADKYLDPDFSDDVKDVNIYDMKVYVTGNYPGGVVNSANVSVNDTLILALNGATPWDSLKTPQSFVTSPRIIRNSTGIAALIHAIKNRRNIKVRGWGALNLNAPSGLKVCFEVLGQVITKP